VLGCMLGVRTGTDTMSPSRKSKRPARMTFAERYGWRMWPSAVTPGLNAGKRELDGRRGGGRVGAVLVDLVDLVFAHGDPRAPHSTTKDGDLRS